MRIGRGDSLPRALALSAVVAVITVPTGLTAWAAASPGITWLLFVDDLHLDFLNTGHLRTLLRTISSELVRDGDVFGIRSSGPSSLSLDLTTHRNLLEGAVRKTYGNGLKPADSLEVRQHGVESNEVRDRATRALAAADEAMRSLEHIDEQRKAVLYISNGYVDLSPARLGAQLSALTSQAYRSNVTIFAIDPRTFAGPSSWDPTVDSFAWRDYLASARKSLRIISDETGGFALVDEEDLVEALKRIGDAMRH